MIGRILAILQARNLEFIRDRSALGWNIFMPLVLVLGLAVIFSGEDSNQFRVGVLGGPQAPASDLHPFFATRFVEFIPVDNADNGKLRVARHQLDMLLDSAQPPQYWVNPESPKGYIAERLLLQTDPAAIKQVVTGRAVRYVDWLLPGVLAMNMLFSCLFGVGYVVVHYRKSGFLKRLRATPLTALEFIVAQVLSRLVLIMAVNALVFAGVKLFLGVAMEGNYLTLCLIALLGGSALISLALVVASRVDSEEFASGVLNLISWPMILLSGVFFSLEGSSPWLQSAAELLPLTQIIDAARAVMIDGAGLADIWPELGALAVMTAVFLTVGALLFKWRFT